MSVRNANVSLNIVVLSARDMEYEDDIYRNISLCNSGAVDPISL